MDSKDGEEKGWKTATKEGGNRRKEWKKGKIIRKTQTKTERTLTERSPRNKSQNEGENYTTKKDRRMVGQSE